MTRTWKGDAITDHQAAVSLLVESSLDLARAGIDVLFVSADVHESKFATDLSCDVNGEFHMDLTRGIFSLPGQGSVRFIHIGNMSLVMGESRVMILSPLAAERLENAHNASVKRYEALRVRHIAQLEVQHQNTEQELSFMRMKEI